MPNDSISKDILRRFDSMASDRTNFDSHCREVAERVLPTHRYDFDQRGYKNQTKGEERGEFVFDSTASIALGRFTSIIDSLLTPRNSKWHKLTVTNKNLASDRDVRLYFDEATEVLFKYRYSPRANFASQNHQVYESLAAFGNGPMYVDQLSDEPGVRFKACSIGSTYFEENHQGLVDTVARRFELTARQAVQKWGEEKLPQKIKEYYQKNDDECMFEFIHFVGPRHDRNPNRKDFRGMPFVSYYIAREDCQLIEEGGYHTFPYPIARYKQAPGEIYARSPAMEVLPSIKTLNEQKKTILKQGHRTVDPVLLGYDDGLVSRFSMRPGTYNAGGVSKEGRPLIHALPVGNVAVGRDMMEDERNDIKDAFLVTLFQILVESPTMTATEVLERTREKGILLAPIFGRPEAEYLGPMIERELDLLAQQNLLPKMPPALIEAKGEYTIEYDSPFSRAQKAEEVAGLMRTYEWAINVATNTGNMSVLDHFDEDAIVPDVSRIQGLPEKWLRAQEEIEQIRQQRAAAQQAQAASQAAPGAAALIKSAAVAKEKAPEELDAMVQSMS